MKSFGKIFLLFYLFQFVIVGCARKGVLTGGPQDETAPVFVSADPAYETTNFEEKKIKISFDEYIKLDDVNKQLIVSPPLKYPLDIRPLGSASKFILIKIKDTLQENTTYSFNFGNSVVDNSEGNVYGNFKYVFSTGPYIDSLSVKGEIKLALSQELATESTVLLYPLDSTYNDSTIYKKQGLYVGSTLDSSNFAITNIKAGKYKVIALKDRSKNFKYDPREDLLGFSDKVLDLPMDTSSIDLKLFKEVLDFKLYKPKQIQMGHIVFPYQGILPENYNIESFSQGETFDQFKILKDSEKDSLHFWYPRNLKDSLVFHVNYQKEKDTFVTLLRSKTYDSLRVTDKTRGVLGLDKEFKVKFNQPLLKIDTSQISLMARDSIPQKLNLRYLEDSMELLFSFEKAEKSTYSLTSLPGAYIGQNEVIEDTLVFKMQTGSVENYGDLTLTFRSKESKEIIVELLDDQGQIVETRAVKSDENVLFSLLKPDKYQVRIKVDENKNGEWDTGDFLERMQPEPVVFFPTMINIRANFSENETIDLIQ